MRAPQEITRSWRVLIAALLGLGFSGGASLYWFGVMVGPLSHRFGWSTSQLSGWSLIVHMVTYVLGPFAGGMVDRFGARTMAFWSIPLVAIGFIGVGLTMNALWLLYLGALIVGVSNSFLTIYTRTINTWFSASRGLALGIAYCGAGLTSIFGPRLSLAVVDSHGWRTGFVFMGLATLIPLPFVYFWLRERRFDSRQQGASETGHSLKVALKMPAFWLIGIGCLLYFFAYNGIQFGLIPLLNEEGLSRAQAANYAGLMGIFIFLGKLLSGVTYDRFRMPYVLALCLAADGAALIALSRIHAVSPLVSLGVIGFVQGAMMNGFPYSVARYFGVRFFGSISGVISLLLSVSALGSLLFSSLRERSGNYRVSLYVGSVILVGAGVLFLLLGTRRYFTDPAAPAHPAEPVLGEGGSSAVLTS